MTFRLSLAAILAACLAASAAMAQPPPAKPSTGVTKPGLGGLSAQEPASAPASKPKPKPKPRPKPEGSRSDDLLPLLLAKPTDDGTGAEAGKPKPPPPKRKGAVNRRAEVKLSR
jgi:hypothetical protein